MRNTGTYRWSTLALATVLAEVLAWAVMLLAWWLVDQEPRFRFEQPHRLSWLFATPVMVLIFLIHIAWRNRSLNRFASGSMLARMVPGISTARVLTRFLLIRNGVALATIAMAGPQYGSRLEKVVSDGMDVVVAVDVSNSMECEDIKPNRMEVARRTMNRLADQLHGDRMGIVVFAGEAFVQLPITTDRSAAKLFISTIGTNSVGRQGTAIGAAIDLAQRSFDPEGKGGRAIVLITDGENHEDDALGAAGRAKEAGIVVHTLGMGTAQGGPIPIRKGNQVTGFRKDRKGATVVSRMDENMLREISEAGGGRYLRPTDGSGDVSTLVEELRTMDRSEVGSFSYTAHEDRFQYPLGVAILLFMFALLINERRGLNLAFAPLRSVRKLLPLAIPLLVLGCGDQAEHARERAMRSGIQHHVKEQYGEAARSFEQASSFPMAHYNLGHAQFRLHAADSAVAAFTEATRSSDDHGSLPQAWYNLGNARLLQAHLADSTARVAAETVAGIRLEGADITERVRLTVVRDSLRRMRRSLEHLTDSALVQGAEAYRQSLRLLPTDEQARYNLGESLRRIAARKKPDGAKPPDKNEEKKELAEKARILLEQAEALVEQDRFKDALDLLRKGLQEEPTLNQRKDYMDKLELVNNIAEGR